MTALDFPATHRNREPILEVLNRLLPGPARVLELAAGSGQHALFFCRRRPDLTWYPTDPEPDHMASIEAWRAQGSSPGLQRAARLDARERDWGHRQLDAVVAINLIHIAPWEVCRALFAGAARHLAPTGLVYLYGALRLDGAFTAASNASFDAGLRAANPDWGVRDSAEVERVAREAGFEPGQRIAMPANNFSLIYRLKPATEEDRSLHPAASKGDR